METAELDTALEELEVRLERLRALYEQYFLGMEKIEPAVARKDVDRRIYVLRREKIRNTAKRFKLQTIIQRYNTFQQYWQRICREIENGTYKRHMLRAQKQNGELLTIAARKRLGRAGRLSQPPEAAPSSQPPSAPPSVQPAAAAPAPIAAAAAPAAAAPPPKPAPAPKPAQKFESLDLDMDFMGDWDPSSRQSPPKPTAAKLAAAPAKPAAPAVAKPAAPVPPPAKPVAPAAAAPAKPAERPASLPPAPVAAPPRPASSQPPRAPVRLAPSPRIPASPRIPTALGAAPRPPKSVQPAPQPPLAAAATPPKPAAASPPPKPAAPPKPATPAAAAPKPAPAAAAPKPAPAPAAAAPQPAAAGYDDARMRALHTKLQQAKQQTREANVSFEGLAKSIRATEAKLREQHKNRKIDFDVVIKGGKAVVKPIVK